MYGKPMVFTMFCSFPPGAEGRYDRGSSPSVMGEATTTGLRIGRQNEWLYSRSRVPEWLYSHSEWVVLPSGRCFNRVCGVFAVLSFGYF